MDVELWPDNRPRCEDVFVPEPDARPLIILIVELITRNPAEAGKQIWHPRGAQDGRAAYILERTVLADDLSQVGPRGTQQGWKTVRRQEQAL